MHKSTRYPWYHDDGIRYLLGWGLELALYASLAIGAGVLMHLAH